MRWGILLLAVSCGGSKLCADTCDGCCIGEVCKAAADNLCGSGGSACVDCTKALAVCSNGACRALPMGGGAGGGGQPGVGGGTADPVLQVTVRYQYLPTYRCNTDCAGQAPPIATCDYPTQLLKSQWQSIRANMATDCVLTETATSVTAECDSHCVSGFDHTCADGGSDWCWQSCNQPYGTTPMGCGFSP